MLPLSIYFAHQILVVAMVPKVENEANHHPKLVENSYQKSSDVLHVVFVIFLLILGAKMDLKLEQHLIKMENCIKNGDMPKIL